MARELRRLLISPQRLAAAAKLPSASAGGAGAGQGDPLPPLQGLAVPLLEEEHHYLQRVLRLRPGDPVAVVDGCGRLWSALLEPGGQLRLEQPLACPLEQQPAPQPSLQLALALPRRDVELVWRMATELGIDRLQPLRAERCVPSGQPTLQRWRAVVAEACEQCERLWRPDLVELQEARAWLAGCTLTAPQASEAGGAKAPAAAAEPYRTAAGSDPLAVGADRPPAPRWSEGARLLATTRLAGIPQLAELLEGIPREQASVSLAVGPEGGWSEGEQEAAITAGWRPVSLGPLILRSGTAAVAAAAQLVAWRQARGAAAIAFTT